MSKRVFSFLFLTNVIFSSFAQFNSLFDLNTYAMFCNNTPISFDISSRTTDDISKITLGQEHYNPWEISNHHKFGDQVTAVVLGVLLKINPEHAENIFMSKLDRNNNFSTNESYSVFHTVRHGVDTLFTIYLHYENPANSFDQAIYYNIIYPDGSTDTPMPGTKLIDNTGNSPQQATHIIHYNNIDYRLVYGPFDIQLDLTDNIIFSLSEVKPKSQYNITPNAEDTLNPHIINMWTYNPGMLKPVNFNDNEEDERAPNMHLVIPDNLDIVVFEEFFEYNLNKQMMDSLKPRYPYQSTNKHNSIIIPVVGKDGGVRIISKFPILEERDISFQENGCIPSNEINRMANKGVKYVKINKHGQIIHVFGTHTEEQPCDFYVMANFIKTVTINKEDVVIFAGDFNLDMDQFTTDRFNVYQNVMDTLHAVEPTYNTLTWDTPYKGSYWGYNHWISEDGDLNNRNYIDYILTSLNGKIPVKSDNYVQVARVNSTDKKFWGVYDLGDHNPVYGRIELPYLSITSTDTIVCAGNSFQLKGKTNIPHPVYSWYKDGALLYTSTDSVYLITNYSGIASQYTCKINYEYMPDTSINKIPVFDTINKKYIFRGKFASSIENMISIKNCINTGINSVKNQHIRIFPNPASDYIYIDLDNSDEVFIKIYTEDGKNVLTKKDNKDLQIDISDLPSGNYIILIQKQGEDIYRDKFIIAR